MIRRRYCLHPGCPEKTEGTYCVKHGAEHAVARPSAAARGYGPRWAKYAKAFLARPENHYCRTGCQSASQIVDHIVAVDGPDDPLFWDGNNHQPLCRSCHSRKTNQQDGGFGNPIRHVTTAGLVVLAGPPCAGKTTYARNLGRLYLDWDDRYAQASGLPLHVRATDDAYVAHKVEAQFRLAVDTAHRLRRPTLVIRGAPERWQRGMYRRMYGAQVFVLEVPAAECLTRLHQSGRPQEAIAATERAIAGWWTRYERSPHDTVVRPASVAA